MVRRSLLAKATTAAIIAGAASIAAAQQGDALATLDSVEGETMVSNGAQYIPGTEGMRLVEGQRVMAVKSGAVIRYEDGCRYVLEKGKLLLIEGKSPCALGKNPAATGNSLAWVPPTAAGFVAVLGAVLLTDQNTDNSSGGPARPSISP